MKNDLTIMTIAGARPNFMKVASITEAVKAHNEHKGTPEINHILVHTGQHYDQKLSKCFFDELRLPRPDINLEVGSGSHAVQTAEIMKRFEPVLLKELPDILIVVGDVNSTVACTLVASKIQYPKDSLSTCGMNRPLIVHVEAGLRSGDRSMPEEINRILTDALSDILFLTEEDAEENLKAEGIPEGRFIMVGNVMIDTLQRHIEQANKRNVREELNIPEKYALVTMHRPSNVDSKDTLEPLLDCLIEISSMTPIVFPVHPRTKNSMMKLGLWDHFSSHKDIMLLDPLTYLDFLNLMSHASLVLTDSGGIQEETTSLQVPCITMRENTERPITVTIGTNYLVGTNPEEIIKVAKDILNGRGKRGQVPPLWDGKAGERIIQELIYRWDSKGIHA